MQEKANLFPLSWATQFGCMYDASRDAARYLDSLGWQTRQDALKSMIANLTRAENEENVLITSFDGKYDERLRAVITGWLNHARIKLDELEQEPQRTEQIQNPYVVGPVLELGTSLFVGRRDLARQLEQDLRRGSHRPTFFLNGERRMGKSSTLRQLPRLLNDHYFLPVFYDLQAPGIRSSTAAFLGTVAEEIFKVLD